MNINSKKTNRKGMAYLFKELPPPELESFLLSISKNISDEFKIVAIFMVNGTESIQIDCDRYAHANITVHFVPYLSRQKWIRTLRHIKKIIEAENIKIVNTFDILDDCWAYALKKIKPNLKWITTLRDSYKIKNLQKIKGYAYKKIIKSDAWVIFWSEHDKTLMLDSVKSQKANMIYPGLAKGQTNSVKSKRTNRVRLVFVGAIEPHNGCKELIKAYSYIKPTHNNVKLEIYGAGSQMLELIMMVETSGLSEHIKFLEIPQDLNHVFTDEVIYVQPYHFHGLSFPLLSAMNNKIPIVAFENEAIQEFLSDEQSALLVQRGNYYKLGEVINKLLGDQVLQKKMGSYASRVATERFAFDQTLDKYRVFYRVVCG